MTRTPKAAAEERLETRLRKLDAIVERLSGGDVSLDEATALYTEGMQLVKKCRIQLKETKGMVQRLNRLTGELEPFSVKGSE